MLLHVTSVCLVLAAMAAMNADVRRALTDMINGDRTAQFWYAAGPIHRYASMAIHTIGPYTTGPVFLLGAVSVVLIGFMLRA